MIYNSRLSKCIDSCTFFHTESKSEVSHSIIKQNLKSTLKFSKISSRLSKLEAIVEVINIGKIRKKVG